MKSKSFAVLAIILLSVTLGFRSLGHTGQVVINSYEDSFPHIKGDYLVWQGNINGDWEILLYNIATREFRRITNNDYNDISPRTDGNYIVWLGYSHPAGEIFVYDILSGKSTQITNNDRVDSPPQIASGRVVWTSCEVTSSVEPGEIFLYRTASGQTEQLTDNTLPDSSPRINDESIMWIRDDGQATKVIVYDLEKGSTTVAPEGFVWEDSSQRDGNLTVLTRHDGTDREIYVYDANFKTYEQVTDNDIEDWSPCISGNDIAWVGGEGPASEIFLNADIEPINTDFDPVDEDSSRTASFDDGDRGGGSSSGDCFIATAAFGSPMERHVTILKNVRDAYLLPSALGRTFVKTYYKYSPPLAHFISKHETLKAAVRISLLPLVAVSYATLHFGPAITVSILVVLLLIPIFLLGVILYFRHLCF